MANLDQLMQAFQNFGKASQEYGIASGIKDATSQVQQLASSTMDVNEKYAAQKALANQLQGRLAGLGASGQQIASAVGSVSPADITTIEGARAFAAQAQTPEDRIAANKLVQSNAKALGEASLETKRPEMDYQFDRQMELAKLNADAKIAAAEARGLQSGMRTREDKMEALKTPFGIARSPKDAEAIKSGYESKATFDSKLSEMIELRQANKGGALLDREALARGKQLSKDLLLEYKNMAKLGVLSKSDEDIINTIIPADPLEFNSPLAAAQGQDPVLHKLKKFKADSDADFSRKVKTRIREEEMVAMLKPNGKATMVPRSRVEAALAAGGKLK